MDFYMQAILTSLLAVLALLLYRAALPKPIPGIPFHPRSAKRLLGDIPDALKYHAQHAETMAFLASRCAQLNSPIVQCFMRPFGRPWVILVDSRESHDIVARRTKEFDRSRFVGDLVKAVIPHNQVTMPTHNLWRRNRKLVSDVMSPSFLNQVSAPQVYQCTLGLLDLWKQKARLAEGHAFDIGDDIRMCTADAMWAATFGEAAKSCEAQSKYLSNLRDIEKPLDPEGVVHIPKIESTEIFATLQTISNSSVIPMNSPLGYNHHRIALKLYPSLRRYMKAWTRLIGARLAESGMKLTKEKEHAKVKSAADLLVERETTWAQKEGRQPKIGSNMIRDELGGLLIGGYETTATAMTWGIKYFGKYQRSQGKLRQCLREAFPEAVRTGGLPSAEEIAKAHLPYLDAVIDEMMRCSSSVPVLTRVATVDTEILGYRIPKGTDILMIVSLIHALTSRDEDRTLTGEQTMGPSFHERALHVEESKRSPSSRQHRDEYERWDQDSLGDFDVGRFLVHDEKGELKYDNRAAPMLLFGGGVRSCFGRKFAYMEMRIIYALIIWRFEVLPPAGSRMNFKAADIMTRHPQDALTRLRALI